MLLRRVRPATSRRSSATPASTRSRRPSTPCSAQVQLPTTRTITLTARKGHLPISVVSLSDDPLQVLLQVESDKLKFAGAGSSNTATFPLTLHKGNNPIIDLTVEARTSGAFPLHLTVLTPDGGHGHRAHDLHGPVHRAVRRRRVPLRRSRSVPRRVVEPARVEGRAAPPRPRNAAATPAGAPQPVGSRARDRWARRSARSARGGRPGRDQPPVGAARQSAVPPVTRPPAGREAGPGLPPPGPPTRPRRAPRAGRRWPASPGISAIGTLLSRVTGMVRTLMTAWALGANGVSDAYNFANTTPNLIYDLVLGGILVRDARAGVRRATQHTRGRWRRGRRLARDLRRVQRHPRGPARRDRSCSGWPRR